MYRPCMVAQRVLGWGGAASAELEVILLEGRLLIGEDGVPVLRSRLGGLFPDREAFGILEV